MCTQLVLRHLGVLMIQLMLLGVRPANVPSFSVTAQPCFCTLAQIPLDAVMPLFVAVIPSMNSTCCSQIVQHAPL